MRVAYVKRQLGIASLMSVIKVKVTVAINRKICFNSISFLWLIDTKLGLWVAYVNRQLRIGTQVSVIVGTVAKKENQFPVNNFSALCFIVHNILQYLQLSHLAVS